MQSDSGINVVRGENPNIVKLRDDVNMKLDDNIKIQKSDEKITITPAPKKRSGGGSGDREKPNLTNEKLAEAKKVRPKLVPLDGIDLLSNPRKLYDSGTASERSSSSDSDDNHSIASSSGSSAERRKRREGRRDSRNVQEENDNIFHHSRTNMGDDHGHSNRSSRNSSPRHSPHHSRGRTADRGDSSRSISSSRSRSESRHGGGDGASGEYQKQKTYEEIQAEKQDLLSKLERLEKLMKVKLARRFTMASNIDDIRHEYNKLKSQRDIDRSVKFQRKALMFCTGGMEYLNNKFDPVDAKLDGWSESIMENITDYDEVFEELHDKYAERINVAPEVKLLMMVAGSGFMFHLSQTMFKSDIPDLSEILRENPDIKRDIARASLNRVHQNHGGFDPVADMMMNGINYQEQAQHQGGQHQAQQGQQRHQAQSQQQQQQQQQQNQAPPQQRQAPPMSGPTGVDDILQQLKKDSEGGQQSGGERSFTTTAQSRRKSGGGKRASGGININV